MQTLIKKKVLYFFLLICLSVVSNAGYTQLSYIQVSGEANLTVFLDGEKKGVTSTELGGLIIEGVAPGNHLIKVVKKDFVPFEETILVKSGEVLLYKVKPFSKVAVFITEKGNEEETDKKASIQTGKLTIQSLPIEISITIPRIEGVNNMRKNKDLWMIEKLTTGEYQSTFTFNGKSLDKTFQIKPNEETHVFVNILSGEITVKYSGEEAAKKKIENKALLNELFLKFLSRTDVKLGLNLDVIKKTDPEMYKRFDKYGRSSGGALLYSYKSRNGERAYLKVTNGYITEIGINNSFESEGSALAFIENYFEQFLSITPTEDFDSDKNVPGIYKRRFNVTNKDLNLTCEVYIYSPSPKSVWIKIEEVKN